MTSLELHERWAALDDDGTWTSGPNGTRAEAEEIVNSRGLRRPALAVRWESDWRTVTAGEQERVWIAARRRDIDQHRLTDDGRRTACARVVMAGGHVLPLAEAVEAHAARPCPRCYPADYSAQDAVVTKARADLDRLRDAIENQPYEPKPLGVLLPPGPDKAAPPTNGGEAT